MHNHDLSPWQHDHTFGQDRARPGERRTFLVIGLTAVTMVVEIGAGLLFGSMALLADGLHMASHAAALAVSAAAYVYARRHAADERYSFGTGKVNALGGYTGAVLLAVFALIMAGESVDRLLHPVAILFDQAILVAVLGLLVNAVSVVILGGHGHTSEEHNHHHHGHADHNLRAAYLHVVADALTSVLAIGALLTGKYLGWAWMDPVMGVVGAVLVARWSWGLMRDTSRVLLDRQAPQLVRDAVVEAVERSTEGDRVVDLHLWSIGPAVFAGALSVVSDRPRAPDHYKRHLPPEVVHATVEVHRRRSQTEHGPVEFDGARYRQTSTHQREWGARLIAELELSGDEAILDVGCGDGTLTGQLAACVPRGTVLGIDASAGMIEAAQSLTRPGLAFQQLDVNDAGFHGDFDLVFSNAALHWVRDHARLLRVLHQALRTGGTLRTNFAADGNCSTFYRVARELMAGDFEGDFDGFEWPWFMPTLETYEGLLAASPFAEYRVWGENADRHFPDEAALLGWIDHPSIVPFKQHLAPDAAERFHAAVAECMVERTRQADGTYFETFRRINVLART